MAGVLKKLASETVIYGLSTILARMINFLIVPLYTRVLSQEDYGSSTEIMSYIAVLQVVLILGLETGCFKFANNPKYSKTSPFSTALSAVSLISFAFFVVVALFSGEIASMMGYEGYSSMITMVGAILMLDSITAILFARLRFMQKALKFAIFKTIKILCELGSNLLLFLVLPSLFESGKMEFLLNFIPPVPDFSYIIFAIFISCLVCMVLFIPNLVKVKISLDKGLLRSMLIYSFPLMVAGLPGIVNESLDRILFRFFAPEGIAWRADLGLYQAAVKLAVIMNLFVQMFRYAAEPFFFAREKDKDSRVLYAKVMEYFVAFCMLIFVGIISYMDIIGLILGRDFRIGLGTVPPMLLSYMILGILFNVSMWYKLSGQTRYAINITISGLIVTASVNIIFMPYFSYWASVWAHLLSGMVMLLYSLWLGNRHYPIPYNWRRICSYVAAGLVAYALFYLFDKIVVEAIPWADPVVARLVAGTLLVLLYMGYVVIKNRVLLSGRSGKR